LVEVLAGFSGFVDLNTTYNSTCNVSFYVDNSTNFTGSDCFEYLLELPEDSNYTFSYA